MQPLAVADSPPSLSRQLQATVASLARREPLLAAGSGAGLTIAAALLAPGSGPSLWEWSRLLLVVAAATLAAASLATARERDENGPRLAVALAATLVALVAAATFGVRTAVLCSIGLSLIDATLVNERIRGAAPLVAAALAALIPWWVWTALDVWDDRLLLLAPLAALALNGAAHVRLAMSVHRADRERPPSDDLSRRGHLLGGWLSLAAATVLALAVGLATGAASAWLITGGLASAVLVGVGVAGERLHVALLGRLHLPALLVGFGLLGLSWLGSL